MTICLSCWLAPDFESRVWIRQSIREVELVLTKPARWVLGHVVSILYGHVIGVCTVGDTCVHIMLQTLPFVEGCRLYLVHGLS